jgi:prevent-host-death family protein
VLHEAGKEAIQAILLLTLLRRYISGTGLSTGRYQMRSEIGAYEAKTKLPELLRQVQKGNRFTITHRGKPVAELVPSGATVSIDRRKAADDMLNFKGVGGIDPDEVAAWIREGRT